MNENCIEFYTDKFNFVNNVEEAKINYIPPLIKRRMNKLDKCALSTLNACYNPNVEYIIFSSKTGEFERLIKIISQYVEENEVSPTLFSGSVHNYIASLFLLIKQKSIPYACYSAVNESLSSGFLSAIISKYDNVLFCYADSFENTTFALCLSLSKTKKNYSIKYRLKLKEKDFTTIFIEDFCNLFNKKNNKLETSQYKIERVYND